MPNGPVERLKPDPTSVLGQYQFPRIYSSAYLACADTLLRITASSIAICYRTVDERYLLSRTKPGSFLT